MNEETGPGGIGRLGTLIGAIAAPTSLVGALLYYFGYYHAYWFFAHFGLNSTVLGFSTADYLMRSLDVLFVPMTVTATVGLLAFWGHDLLRGRIAAGAAPQVLRYALPGITGLGFLLALGGFWSVLDETFLSHTLALAPLSLSVGVALLSYALHLRRMVAAGADLDDAPEPDPDNARDDTGQDGNAQDDTAPDAPSGDAPPATPRPASARPEWAALAEWAVVFVLVGLGLIWAANDHAASVGEIRARRFVADMGRGVYPSAVLHSERSLSITAPGVRETECRDGKAAYRFRYDGLTLVLQSGNQYVLLPNDWTPADGVALLIPRGDSVRLEFGPPPSRARPSPTC
ncbi:hypothetical protein P8605_06395 [Streptomyces sp. T-3]|nr:hypothetical protein [Streptomyces sp. T-3]